MSSILVPDHEALQLAKVAAHVYLVKVANLCVHLFVVKCVGGRDVHVALYDLTDMIEAVIYEVGLVRSEKLDPMRQVGCKMLADGKVYVHTDMDFSCAIVSFHGAVVIIRAVKEFPYCVLELTLDYVCRYGLL